MTHGTSSPQRLNRHNGWIAVMVGLLILALVSTPASAQFSPSFQMLKAVRERDGAKVTELLDGDAVLINTRERTSGETPLLISVTRRDSAWVRFLLGRRADPNLADRSGKTPLMAAAEAGFAEAIPLLVSVGARVNQDNPRGETALHFAVQRRDTASIRALIDAGANADAQDNIAGLSPRDYARRDSRGAALLAAMEPRAAPVLTTPAIGPVAGPN